MPDRKTITVQRANVILDVPEEWLDRYLDEGYSVIDAKGNIIRSAIPKDVGILQKAYLEHTQRIKELEEEIEQLKQKKISRQKKAQ